MKIIIQSEILFQKLDCSQPSIFSYFSLIIECEERSVRELGAIAKWEEQGSGGGGGGGA